MPSFAGLLTEEELQALIAYVQVFEGACLSRSASIW